MNRYAEIIRLFLKARTKQLEGGKETEELGMSIHPFG